MVVAYPRCYLFQCSRSVEAPVPVFSSLTSIEPVAEPSAPGQRHDGALPTQTGPWARHHAVRALSGGIQNWIAAPSAASCWRIN
jgi:hypothetical protein